MTEFKCQIEESGRVGATRCKSECPTCVILRRRRERANEAGDWRAVPVPTYEHARRVLDSVEPELRFSDALERATYSKAREQDAQDLAGWGAWAQSMAPRTRWDVRPPTQIMDLLPETTWETARNPSPPEHPSEYRRKSRPTPDPESPDPEAVRAVLDWAWKTYAKDLERVLEDLLDELDLHLEVDHLRGPTLTAMDAARALLLG